ncbi:arylamine N-acetyltransferase [Mesobacillus subterraneus]|uniref:arylamine N-acetyltransferase family protein n=1 Tax=Mesobacillus subterraneus TaxID=285983 RepID=UPI00203D29E8|nr:arylamine N-acetyltransferase [Mesobacillus subterraneus]MCM3665119.1 arylamine N-acetyltransferase [Mesobacillus subterraneus]MCM3684132.1 arylamine N-acetyltransferase [Mesobacillus subterraneus]
MNDLNRQFRNRIGFPEETPISLGNLDIILELTAAAIPFENLCTLSGDLSDLNEKNLTEKIIERKEGGLCYDLNGLLYLFLRENGLDVQLVRGAVYVPDINGFSPTGKTHAAILLKDAAERYLVDTGFGGNLPLKPVPLNGMEISSSNGEFRVKKEKNEFGDYFLEMKLKNKDTEWRLGYAFDSTQLVKDISELNEMKKIITEHPQSPFNKKLLLTRVTAEGSMVLTETSYTHWKDGKMAKEEIDSERFRELARKYYKVDVK